MPKEKNVEIFITCLKIVQIPSNAQVSKKMFKQDKSKKTNHCEAAHQIIPRKVSKITPMKNYTFAIKHEVDLVSPVYTTKVH